MAITKGEILYDAGRCMQGVTVDDANELLDLGLGQYIADHVPGTIYYIDAPCGTTCKDENNKVWKNCTGWVADNTPITTVKKKMPVWVIPAAIIGFIAITYFIIKRKK